MARPPTNQRRDNANPNQQSGNDQHQMFPAGNYQYTLADIPKLAEQAANMYAQNPTDKASYMQYYTDFYTKQLSQVFMMLEFFVEQLIA